MRTPAFAASRPSGRTWRRVKCVVSVASGADAAAGVAGVEDDVDAPTLGGLAVRGFAGSASSWMAAKLVPSTPPSVLGSLLRPLRSPNTSSRSRSWSSSSSSSPRANASLSSRRSGRPSSCPAGCRGAVVVVVVVEGWRRHRCTRARPATINRWKAKVEVDRYVTKKGLLNSSSLNTNCIKEEGYG